MSLRKQARNRSCTVRLPGCDGGGETTVLAHIGGHRFGGGMGRKSSDLAAAWCCAPCHDRIDGRVPTPYMTKTEIQLAHAQGALETIVTLETEGKIKT